MLRIAVGRAHALLTSPGRAPDAVLEGLRASAWCGLRILDGSLPADSTACADVLSCWASWPDELDEAAVVSGLVEAAREGIERERVRSVEVILRWLSTFLVSGTVVDLLRGYALARVDRLAEATACLERSGDGEGPCALLAAMLLLPKARPQALARLRHLACRSPQEYVRASASQALRDAIGAGPGVGFPRWPVPGEELGARALSGGVVGG